jgi:hypothetical protein
MAGQVVRYVVIPPYDLGTILTRPFSHVSYKHLNRCLGNVSKGFYEGRSGFSSER